MEYFGSMLNYSIEFVVLVNLFILLVIIIEHLYNYLNRNRKVMSESSPREPITKKFERFVSKLKVVGRQSKQTNVMVKVENPGDTLQRCETPEAIDDAGECSFDEGKDDSPKNFKTFCREMEKFVNYVKDNQDLTNYIYKYPQNLQRQIDVHVDDLQNLLAEISETANNIKKLKQQRNLIKKETSALKKTIRRVKDNETYELESIVSQYDKEMYNRWSKAKYKIDAMEDLMFDVQEKQIVLESLQKLIDRCIVKVKDGSFIDEESEKNSNNDDSISSLPSIFSLENKIPTPPPAPTFIPRPASVTTNNLSRSSSRLSWAQRRFRAEKRGNVVPVRLVMENRENDPFAFTFHVSNANGNNVNFSSNIFESNWPRFSSNSTDTISSSGSNNQRQVENDFDVKTESQMMLFEERNRNAVLIMTESNDSFNSHTIPEESSSSNCS